MENERQNLRDIHLQQFSIVPLSLLGETPDAFLLAPFCKYRTGNCTPFLQLPGKNNYAYIQLFPFSQDTFFLQFFSHEIVTFSCPRRFYMQQRNKILRKCLHETEQKN